VYDDSYYCFGCRRGGSVIDLQAALTGVEPRGDGYRALRRELIAVLLPGENAA
jgi:hypothetical protein